MMINTFKGWLPLALAITVLSGLIYVSVQQSYRMNANDPQVQIAEDTIASISNNQQLSLPTNKIDISKSLSPFVIILDDAGKSIFSSAILNGKPVVPPSGVLDYVKAHGEDRVTWQPQAGVREAIVVRLAYNATSKKSGYVIVGRSLREAESRIDRLTKMSAVGWLTALALTLGSQLALAWKKLVPVA